MIIKTKNYHERSRKNNKKTNNKKKAESLLKGYYESLGLSEKLIDLHLKRSTITFIYSDDHHIGDYHMRFILMIDAFFIDRIYKRRFYFSESLPVKTIVLSKNFGDIFDGNSLNTGDIIYFKDDKYVNLNFNKFINEKQERLTKV